MQILLIMEILNHFFIWPPKSPDIRTAPGSMEGVFLSLSLSLSLCQSSSVSLANKASVALLALATTTCSLNWNRRTGTPGGFDHVHYHQPGRRGDG